jgi:hypothetical protein
LRSLIGDAACSRERQSEASYELAQLLDSQQRCDEAFQALLAAKQFQKPAAAGLLRKYRASRDKDRELIQMLDSSCYERWQTIAESDTPYRAAILTSHPRSGTTLVEQLLDSHDEVISADEFDVFTQWVYLPIVRRFHHSTPVLKILDELPPAVRAKARAMYWQRTEAVLDEPIGERMLLDKNPAMTLMLPVMNWLMPEVRMLVALRDPRDVILSCFMQRIPQLTSVSANWLALSDAADFYVHSMNAWLAVRKFTRSPWLEFRYEDVVDDLEREAHKILDFLGLPWDERVLKFYEHAREKVVRSPTYKDVTQPVYKRAVGRWQNYAQHFEPILEKLHPFIKEFGYE